MNRWLILYDDGKASRIHSLDVEGDTISAAIEKSGIPVKHIFACAAYGNLGAAATVMLRTMKQSQRKNKARS
jgi:hypothetical protein